MYGEHFKYDHGDKWVDRLVNMQTSCALKGFIIYFSLIMSLLEHILQFTV